MPKAKERTKPVLRGGLDATPPVVSTPANRTAEQQRIERLLDIIPTVCSGQWREDVIAGVTDYPIPGMVLSRCKVLTTGEMISNNHGEQGTRRWHPALTDRLEDMLDRLSIERAAKYFHPQAIRYDHMTPYREAIVYDPRSIRVDDPDAWILRCVKLEEWPGGRSVVGARTVRTSWPNVFRVRSADGGWLKHKGKDVLADGGGRHVADDRCPDAVPEDAVVNAYIQVTE